MDQGTVVFLLFVGAVAAYCVALAGSLGRWVVNTRAVGYLGHLLLAAGLAVGQLR